MPYTLPSDVDERPIAIDGAGTGAAELLARCIFPNLVRRLFLKKAMQE